jgi:quinol monooxygenase YgiN
MPVIVAKLVLPADEIPAYLDHAAALVERTQDEPGCNTFTFTRDARRDDTLWVIEDWASDADMLSHQAAPHVKAFLAATAHAPVRETAVKKFNIASVETLA